MITAAAPACWPKIAFATRAHAPRFATAIWLSPGATPLNVYALTEQPSDSSADPIGFGSSTVVAGLSWSTTIGPVIGVVNGCWFALIRSNVEPGIVGVTVRLAPANVGMTSWAAVAMAPSAVPGEP